MKRVFTAILFMLFSTCFLHAQSQVTLTINHLLGDEVFSASAVASNEFGNEFNVSRLQYYISGVSLTHDGGNVTLCNDIYILADANEPGSFDLGTYEVTQIEAIQFSIGVNMPQNNGDPAQWPADHALSPKFPSMHWGWEAGYRFVAMEGMSGEGFGQTYQIHALGNQNYFSCKIPVEATNNDGTLNITLNADYAKALNGIDVSKGLITHGDYNEAVTLLRNFSQVVFTNQNGEGSVLGVPNFAINSGFHLFPNPSHGNTTIMVDGNGFTNLQMVVTDLSGRQILNKTLPGSAVSINLEKGVYLVQLQHEGNTVGLKRLLVQ
ncbi:T9SS type A sorting domain-containing protein [bacterium]|nr:T9SS type A sorting domain-containing protein [bacterium]